jgi:O-antigen ligase
VISVGHRLLHLPKGSGSAVLRGAGLVLAALLCQTFFWSPVNPLALKIVVAGIALLAAAKPDVALLVLAAAVPFGRVISTLTSPAGPVAITEALALAYLVGWALGRLRGPVHDGPASPGLLCGYGFAAVVVASLLVDIGVLRYWKDYWQPFLGQLLAYLARDYLNLGIEFRPWANGFGGLASAATAARFLEGLGLMRAVQTLCDRDAAFGRRLLWTLAIAAVGAAVLSAGAAFELSSTEDRSLLSVLQASRIAVFVTKVNTAGSFFVLFIPVLIGLGVWRAESRPRPLPVRVLRWTMTATGAGSLLAALWLTRTRAAFLAFVIVTTGASVYAMITGPLARSAWRSVAAVAAACSVAGALVGLGFYVKTTQPEGRLLSTASLKVRATMWSATLPMIGAHPLFGTGIGQFQYQAGAFVPDEAAQAQFERGRFHAHNQFLEVTAELGVIGGVLFVGMFAAILSRAWKAFRTSRDPVLGGAIAGVTAFLVTCLAGQPLLYDVVALPFWMVLGVVLAGGDASPAAASARQTAAVQLRSRLTAAFLIVLALSIPVRVWQGQDQVNFALANYGFSEWHRPTARSSRTRMHDGSNCRSGGTSKPAGTTSRSTSHSTAGARVP